MGGLLARVDHAVASHAQREGDTVLLLGETKPEFGGSAYWEVCLAFNGGQPPRVDLDREKALVELLVTAAERGLVRSAHDCSDGGLGVALAEVAMGGAYAETGFAVNLPLQTHG